MILRITKKLNSSLVKEITKAKREIKLTHDFIDSGYLSDDLNMGKNKSSKNISININIGVVPCSEYWFVYPTREYFLIQESAKEIKGKKLNNSLIKLNIKKNKIGNKIATADFTLQIGEPPNGNYRNQFAYSWISSRKESEKKLRSADGPIIFDWIHFFWDKQSIYKKVSNILIKNKKMLIENTGEIFTKDILDIFSVKKNNIMYKKVVFPEKSISRKLIGDEVGLIDFANEKIEKIISFSKINKEKVEWIKLSIKENFLYVDFYLSPTFSLFNINYPEFEKYIKNNVASWLKDQLIFRDFEVSVYEKMKTRILLKELQEKNKYSII